jgi:hypothetical protein
MMKIPISERKRDLKPLSSPLPTNEGNSKFLELKARLQSQAKGREVRKRTLPLSANTEYIGIGDGIFISKIDYVLSEETTDGYIFKKQTASELNRIEQEKAFDVLERIKKLRDINATGNGDSS